MPISCFGLLQLVIGHFSMSKSEYRHKGILINEAPCPEDFAFDLHQMDETEGEERDGGAGTGGASEVELWKEAVVELVDIKGGDGCVLMSRDGGG